MLQYNDVVRVYQDKEPWQLCHCWEVLSYENKWNKRVLEIGKATKGKKDPAATTVETETHSNQDETTLPRPPEGRDSA